MSFSDPITVTLNAVESDLPRVFQPLFGGPVLYQSADEMLKVEISHQIIKGKRERHMVKLTQKAITPNPFVPAENVENYSSCYIVLDNPRQGFDDTELQFLVQGLADFIGLEATNRDKFVGGEA